MRILIITDILPFPPEGGAPLRTYNILIRLAKKHEISIAAFLETPKQADGIKHLQQFCRNIETSNLHISRFVDQPVELFRFFLSGKPPDFRYYYRNDLAAKINRILSKNNFDIVHIEHSCMGLYLNLLSADLKKKSVWGLHDIDWVKYARISKLETKKARKFRLGLHSIMLRFWQPRFATRFQRCITVSEEDRNLLKLKNPEIEVDVVPNGVDIRMYEFMQQKKNEPVLIFVGNMNYSPNVDAVIYFCEQVLPEIRQKIPDIAMWIVGAHPRPEVLKLAGKGVHVTGRVVDVRPYYERSSICVVPLRAGGGTRLKILESMAYGRPVVSTSIGCEGLNVTDKIHLLIADDSKEFVNKISFLLQDENERMKIVKNARKLVETNYNWDEITENLIRIYEEIVP